MTLRWWLLLACACAGGGFVGALVFHLGRLALIRLSLRRMGIELQRRTRRKVPPPAATPTP